MSDRIESIWIKNNDIYDAREDREAGRATTVVGWLNGRTGSTRYVLASELEAESNRRLEWQQKAGVKSYRVRQLKTDREALKAENAELRKVKDCAEAVVKSASDDPLSARDALVDSQELADLEKALAAEGEG